MSWSRWHSGPTYMNWLKFHQKPSSVSSLLKVSGYWNKSDLPSTPYVHSDDRHVSVGLRLVTRNSWTIRTKRHSTQHISNSSRKIYPTRSFEMPSVSNFTHFHLPVIQSHIVQLFNDFWWWCTFWASFTWIIFKAGTATFKLGSPFLNCWKRKRRVPINFYELRMNFIWCYPLSC
jgi:hypothetical protein